MGTRPSPQPLLDFSLLGQSTHPEAVQQVYTANGIWFMEHIDLLLPLVLILVTARLAGMISRRIGMPSGRC
jgi:hypothetical protein